MLHGGFHRIAPVGIQRLLAERILLAYLVPLVIARNHAHFSTESRAVNRRHEAVRRHRVKAYAVHQPVTLAAERAVSRQCGGKAHPVEQKRLRRYGIAHIHVVIRKTEIGPSDDALLLNRLLQRSCFLLAVGCLLHGDRKRRL